MQSWRWIISHRCGWINGLCILCNARISFHSVYSWDHSTKSSICQLPICNLFTQHMLSLWRDATSELWIPVLFPQYYCNPLLQFLLCYFLQFTFQQTILHPHNTFNPLCSAKPVSLTTSLNSWGKVIWLFVCRFHVAADAGSAPCHQSVCNTFRSDAFLLLVDKPWFRNRGKSCCLLITPCSWGSPTALHQFIIITRSTSRISSAVAGEKDRFCKGCLSLSIFLFCFCFACFILLYFVCFVLSKNTKKLVSCI